jgi:hypothetical protein
MARLTIPTLLCVLVTGCGGDDERTASTTPTPTATPAADLQRFLVAADDGFTPQGDPVTETAFPTAEFPADAERRLRDVGFVSSTFQTHEAANGNAGVSSVMVFESEQGARDWLEYETSDAVLEHQLPDSKLDRFESDAVPGARGFTGPDLHGNPIGQIYWAQGRCMLLVASEGGGDFEELLGDAAAAIHERTDGSCP